MEFHQRHLEVMREDDPELVDRVMAFARQQGLSGADACAIAYRHYSARRRRR